MSLEYISEEMYDKYKLTEEQIKACKSVFRAMRKAGSLGVKFWDYYGTLTAYNGKVFRCVSMEDGVESIEISNCEAGELTYYERLDNFFAGCADDAVYLELN